MRMPAGVLVSADDAGPRFALVATEVASQSRLAGMEARDAATRPQALLSGHQRDRSHRDAPTFAARSPRAATAGRDTECFSVPRPANRAGAIRVALETKARRGCGRPWRPFSSTVKL